MTQPAFGQVGAMQTVGLMAAVEAVGRRAQDRQHNMLTFPLRRVVTFNILSILHDRPGRCAQLHKESRGATAQQHISDIKTERLYFNKR
jgi:hypothetical protein